MTGEPSEQTDLWNTLGPYWLVGVMLAALVVLILALVAADEQPPRRVVVTLLRRLVYVAVWPVALPVYLVVALRRNRW